MDVVDVVVQMLGFAIAHKYAFSHTDFMETKAEQRARAEAEVS